MAQITVLVDDLNGSQKDTETVQFSLDGISYEMELCKTNREKLKNTLSDYIAAGRRTGGKTSRPRAVIPASRPKVDNSVIREWARGKGHSLKDRGRIPAQIVQEYAAAH